MKYEGQKYQFITLTKRFIVLSALGVILLVVMRVYQKEISLEIGVASTLGTFLYSFFTYAFLGFVQTKYVNFKQKIAELLGNIKIYYNTILLFKQKKVTNANKKALVKFLERLKSQNPNDFSAKQETLNPIYKANKDLKLKKKVDVYDYFNVIGRLSQLSIIEEELDIYGDKYITGELKRVFIFFTVLFVFIIATLTSYGIYSSIIGICLVIIVIFSTLFIFHVDGFSYSEERLRQGKIQETIDYIKSTKKI